MARDQSNDLEMDSSASERVATGGGRGKEREIMRCCTKKGDRRSPFPLNPGALGSDAREVVKPNLPIIVFRPIRLFIFAVTWRLFAIKVAPRQVSQLVAAKRGVIV